MDSLEYLPDWENKYDYIVGWDRKELFISEFGEYYGNCDVHELLKFICVCGSVQCADAIFSGETPLTVDLNMPDCHGWYPLHHAAFTFQPSIIELLLYLGAQPDVGYTRDIDLGSYLPHPLTMILEDLSSLFSLGHRRDWPPMDDVILERVAYLCLPRYQWLLESLELLAWKTKQVEEVFLNFAMDGNILPVAALLIVARKKIMEPIAKCREMLARSPSRVLGVGTQKTSASTMIRLIELFEAAGNEIEAYAKQYKRNVTSQQTLKDVSYLLQQASLASCSDVDSNYYKWYLDELMMPIAQPTDIHMPHYSTSGHRWTSELRGKAKSVLLASERKKWMLRERPKDIHMPHYSTPGYRWTSESRVKAKSVLLASLRKYYVGPYSDSFRTNITPRIGVEGEANIKMQGSGLGFGSLWSRKPLMSIASIIKRVTKRG